jgi:hypothetical protein
MPCLIVEHSFTIDGEPASNTAVVNMLAGNHSLFMEIMRTYVTGQSFLPGKSTG